MLIPFGRHKGKSVEWVMLKDPSYTHWVLNEPNPQGKLIDVKNEILRLMYIFDCKPFIRECTGCKERLATRASLCDDNPIPWWWCNECEPDLLLTRKDRIDMIITYREALNHVANCCGGRKGDLNYLIRVLAQAKGLPKRVGEEQAQLFFAVHML